MKTKLYIVIVNFNGYKDTIECLESLLKQDFNNYQIIVIDNSPTRCDLNKIDEWSKGEYKEKIDTLFPEIIHPLVNKPIESINLEEDFLYLKELNEKLILLKAKRNDGFAAANNIGLKYIKKFGNNSDLIWLLNNDTIISKGLISDLVNEIYDSGARSDKVIYGTPLLEYYEPNKIQAVGGKYNKYLGLTTHVGEGLNVDVSIDITKLKVDYPIGASMIVTNKFLKKVGLLNEEYFLFYEELDWVMRLKKVKENLKILNIFGVYHKQGESTNTKTNQNKSKAEFIDLLFIKNRILFSKKYFKKHTWSVILFISIITVVRRFILGEFKRGVKIYKLLLREIF